MPKPDKNKGKSMAVGPPAISTPESNSQANPLENFEIELLWCIQQLEASLSSNKMNPRIAENMKKNLSLLKSNKAPLIKKRQLMRTLFGDYRAKMAEEEKKFYKANSNIKFSDLSKTKEKALFVKKSSSIHPLTEGCSQSTSESSSGVEKAESSMENDISKGICEKVVIEERTKSENFSFKPSDNSFRFNFSVPVDNA